ncbi:MAG: tripartite tricarboxylate transporter substrate binding protein, partial [Hydrogenophaga sp.]|nr:tripartite tricarboxylate transporter substrate binding protein [Hydrogenophaga sp.]
MTTLPRRPVLKALLALAGAAALRPGEAQQRWPTRSLRIIVVYPPGGLSDGVARSLAERLALQLGM